jgi:hypothetical protein
MFRGRTIGIVILTTLQFAIGAIHVFFGLWLLSSTAPFDFFLIEQVSTVYSIYTLVFGVVVLVFAYGIWQGRNWGWNGTFLILGFVIVADALTLLNLPSIPGIPKFAAGAEILYSLLILIYLMQPNVRAKYKTPK